MQTHLHLYKQPVYAYLDDSYYDKLHKLNVALPKLFDLGPF